MYTLPANATDDELRAAVIHWFNLLASGAIEESQEFLFVGKDSLSVNDFVERVAQLTSGTVSQAEPISWVMDVDDLPVDGPVDIVCRWVPGPESTGKFPGFVGDILHAIPVDGQWSEIDVSLFIRLEDDKLSLQLRDVLKLE